MGAWGPGSFENDDALDWIAELAEAEDISSIDEALDGIAGAERGELEAEECSVAIAAAEVVAALKGKAARSLPEEVKAWRKGKRKPSAKLVAKAKRAVDAVLSSSELKELWQESNEFSRWKRAVTNLKSRLT